MKSKKLITLIAIVAVIIAIVVIMASVFSVQKITPICHKFDGTQTLPSDGSPTADNVLEFSRGKSIFFLSKEKLLSELNAEYSDWHAFAVVKNFPNILEVHFVKRVAAVKVDVQGNMVYIDSFGYVTSQPQEGNCIDITSVFEHRDAAVNETGKPFKFTDEANNLRLQYVLQTIIASWQCNLELEDLPVILGTENVFTFDNSGNMIINTLSGARIKVISPEQNLEKRIIAAYSVYYTDKENLQQDGVEITVDLNGVVTPNVNSK